MNPPQAQIARLTRLYATWDDKALSAKALATARMGILDVVGCMVGGAATETAAIVRSMAQEQGALTAASVIGTDVRLPAPLAALANGVAGHVLDYDDMNSTMVGHPSVVLVPALFALGEWAGKGGRDVLSAYILGFEVDAFFGRIMVPRHYDMGWHSTSSIGILGATAAASRLLGMDPPSMANALAIAASNVAGLRANFGSMAKSLHAGQAAEGAVRAVLLSTRGFTANTTLFDAPGGFFDAYGRNAKAKEAPAEGALEIETSGIGIKPHACCGAGVSLIDAALEIRLENEIDPAEITEVKCIVSEMAMRIMPFRTARDGLQAKYCLEYCAAVALIDARGGLAQFDDARVAREDVQKLMKKVRVTSDPSMASGGGRFQVDVTVKLRDGRKLTTELILPLGHPRRPMQPAQLLDKFLECAAGPLGPDRARAAAQRLGALDDEPQLDALMDLLRPST